MKDALATIGVIAIILTIFWFGAFTHDKDVTRNCKEKGKGYTWTAEIECKVTSSPSKR